MSGINNLYSDEYIEGDRIYEVNISYSINIKNDSIKSDYTVSYIKQFTNINNNRNDWYTSRKLKYTSLNIPSLDEAVKEFEKIKVQKDKINNL